MNKLSIAIATFNEEANIDRCLESIKDIAWEIVIVDGTSSDRTVEIAKKYNARVYIKDNPPIFHKNKQKAFDLAKGDWVLYLDADEVVSKRLGEEIVNLINMPQEEIESYQEKLESKRIFSKHLKLLEKRDGKIGEDGDFVAFFFPRLNFFLGKFLKYGGVYPDGVIRLFKKDKAYLPCISVHEQMVVLGKVGWVQNPLLHYDAPNFKRYMEKNSRYIDLYVSELKRDKVKKNLSTFIQYIFIKPIFWFFKTQILNKGILDGVEGVIFSFFSALRFPRAYFRYLNK